MRKPGRVPFVSFLDCLLSLHRNLPLLIGQKSLLQSMLLYQFIGLFKQCLLKRFHFTHHDLCVLRLLVWYRSKVDTALFCIKRTLVSLVGIWLGVSIGRDQCSLRLGPAHRRLRGVHGLAQPRLERELRKVKTVSAPFNLRQSVGRLCQLLFWKPLNHSSPLACLCFHGGLRWHASCPDYRLLSVLI